MRTQEEIVKRARERKPQDMFGFELTEYASAMTAESQEQLRGDIFKEDAELAGGALLSDDAIRQQMIDYMPFWRENGEPMYYGLTSISSWAEIQSAEVKFGQITLREVSVDKFGFKPIGGSQVELTCRVQARPSDDEYVALLHAQLSHGKLTITTDQADLFE